jgi:hypothetical protein
MSGTTETSGSPRDDDRDEEARLRSQEHHAEFAIQREAQALAKQARRLADEMATLIVDEERTEADIEAEIRTEHWGRDPERPLAWKDRRDSGSS